MRTKKTPVYHSSSSPTAKNGNYDVSIDFSKGSRGVVTVEGVPDKHRWSIKSQVTPNAPFRPK
jgi:hypothetical protein